jgi:hypothetical protein
VDGVLRPARCDRDLVMLDRIAAQERDIEAARRVTAVGDDEPENA